MLDDVEVPKNTNLTDFKISHSMQTAFVQTIKSSSVIVYQKSLASINQDESQAPPLQNNFMQNNGNNNMAAEDVEMYDGEVPKDMPPAERMSCEGMPHAPNMS